MNLDLRSERQRLGMTLEDMADSTRIPLRYLAALEDNDLVVLPPGPFRRGYLRQYLEELGFDPDGGDLPHDLHRELAGPHEDLPRADDDDDLALIEGTSTTGTIPRGEEIPVLRLVLTGFVLTLAVVLGLKVGSQFIDTSGGASDGSAQAMPPQSLQVRAVEPTRIRVVVDGEVARDDLLRAGETVEVSGQARIELDAADLTTLVVHHNNERIEPLHNLSHGRRLVFVQQASE